MNDPAESMNTQIKPEGEVLQGFLEIAEEAQVLIKRSLFPDEFAADRLFDLSSAAGNLLPEKMGVGDDSFSGPGRSRGAKIGTEIGDGEIYFMADAGDNRDF